MQDVIRSYNPRLMSRHDMGEGFVDDMLVEPRGYTPEVISHYNAYPPREKLEEFMSWMRDEIERDIMYSLQLKIKNMEEKAYLNARQNGFRVNEREAVCHCLTSAIRTFSEAHEPPASELDRAGRHALKYNRRTTSNQ